MLTSARQFRLFFLPVVFVVLLLLLALPTLRLHGQADSPVVYVLFFFSPTCPHCHQVIENDLPVFEEEFGDSLQIIAINTTENWGSALYSSVCEALNAWDKCGGVPLMVVGDTFLAGSAEIPERLPGITRAGLEAGGISLPEFPGSADLLAAWNETYVLPQNGAEGTEEASAAADTGSATDAGLETLETLDTSRSLADKLAADPEANALAILVLMSLLFSVAWLAWQQYGADVVNLQTPALILAGLLGLGLGISLVAESSEDSTASTIAYGVVGLLGLALVLIPLSQSYRSYVVPLVTLAGIAVAVYLTHIETSDTTAVCGLIGDCNTVQQSDYAELFGVLPIGVLGVFGYMMMLVVWAVSRLPNLAVELRRQLETVFMLLVIGGAIFSAYLTFLEPFVIGATCAWCLTSAVTMLLLLWLVVPTYFENGATLTTQKAK